VLGALQRKIKAMFGHGAPQTACSPRFSMKFLAAVTFRGHLGFTIPLSTGRSLESETSAELLGVIKRTSAEFRQTVVMITHNNDIARLADRIVHIGDGKLWSEEVAGYDMAF